MYFIKIAAGDLQKQIQKSVFDVLSSLGLTSTEGQSNVLYSQCDGVISTQAYTVYILDTVTGSSNWRRKISERLDQDNHFSLLSDTPQLVRALAEIPSEFCFILQSRHRDDETVLMASRLGLVPLYFSVQRDLLAVSTDLSELVSILRGLNITLTLDREYIGLFFSSFPSDRFSSQPASTIYREIKMVPPGRFYDLASVPSTTRIYWSWWDSPRQRTSDVPDLVRSAILDSIQRHVANIAEGNPVGILLSGGIDSSSIACAVSRMDNNIYCYTNTFNHPDIRDDLWYASHVAKHIGGESRFIPSDDMWALKNVPDLGKSPQPEPYQAWFYAQEVSVADLAASDNVQVMLDGYGSDELFSPVFTGLGKRYTLPSSSSLNHLQIAADLRRGRIPPLLFHSPTADLSASPPFLRPAFVAEINLHEMLHQSIRNLFALVDDPTIVHRIASFVLMGNTVDNLCWVDREVYRSRSIRLAHPFLDARLVETLFQIDPNELLVPALNKPLLRRAMRGLLPKVIERRKTKTDFTFMVNKGYHLEQERIKQLFKESFTQQLGFIDEKAFHITFERCLDGRATSERDSLWSTICLEIWLRDQVERSDLILSS